MKRVFFKEFSGDFFSAQDLFFDFFRKDLKVKKGEEIICFEVLEGKDLERNDLNVKEKNKIVR